MKISAIMPTRNRPENLERIFNSALDTISKPDMFEFSLRIDNDDILSLPMIEKYKDKLNIRLDTKPRNKKMSEVWNEAWRNATGEIYQMIGDDFIYRTKNWDEEIRKLFEVSQDKIMLVFGKDGIQNGNISTHGFVHKNWTDVLGYFVPTQLNIYYVDTWVDDIARKIKRRIYKNDLLFEHMHPAAKKSTMDAVYEELQKNSQNEQQLYNSFYKERKEDSEKLRKVMILSEKEKNPPRRIIGRRVHPARRQPIPPPNSRPETINVGRITIDKQTGKRSLYINTAIKNTVIVTRPESAIKI